MCVDINDIPRLALTFRGMCAAESSNIQTRHSTTEQEKAGAGIALIGMSSLHFAY